MNVLGPFLLVIAGFVVARVIGWVICLVIDLYFWVHRWEFKEGDVFVAGRWDGEY